LTRGSPRTGKRRTKIFIKMKYKILLFIYIYRKYYTQHTEQKYCSSNWRNDTVTTVPNFVINKTKNSTAGGTPPTAAKFSAKLNEN
jgi:hypothetical protein